ncbi:MAG: hypothetical protein ABI167_11355 [Nitrosospira sp.]
MYIKKRWQDGLSQWCFGIIPQVPALAWLPSRLQAMKNLLSLTSITNNEENLGFIFWSSAGRIAVDLHAKLAEWEAFYSYHRPHGSLGGKPYEQLVEKMRGFFSVSRVCFHHI